MFDDFINDELARILLFIIVIISGLLIISGLNNTHVWGGDFSVYIMQARSIIEMVPHEFIESNRFTVEESSSPVGPVVYPWGWDSWSPCARLSTSIPMRPKNRFARDSMAIFVDAARMQMFFKPSSHL